MTRVFIGVAGFRAALGAELGPGDWFELTQQRIDDFADVTEDWQWIHVDPERAAASDLGRTVAHGYLTLSLLPRLSSELFQFAEVDRAVNYGIERVRFPAMVHPGDRIRAHATIRSVDEHGPGVLGRVGYSIEIQDRAKPACVLEALMLVVPLPTRTASEADA